MKYINKILIGAVAVVMSAACSDKFLDTTPTSSIATGNVFASTDNVKQAVNGVAYLMCTQHGAYSQGFCGENVIMYMYNEYPSQEFRYSTMSDGWAVIMNAEWNARKTSTYARYPWAYYYEIISNANSIVANVDGATGSDAEKAFYKAQARTFRDYAFVKLLEIYSYRWQDTNDGASNGIVMRMDETTGDMPLSTVAECYKLIYEDLDAAIAEYEASGMDRGANEVWLPNINVAYAVYARAALHKQDYATALKMAQNARKGISLMSNDEYKSGFCRPTSEWMFGSFGDATENNWYWTFGCQFACNGFYAASWFYGAGEIEKEFTDKMYAASPSNKDDVRMKLFLTQENLGLDLYNDQGTDEDGNAIDHIDSYGTLISQEAMAAAKSYSASMTPNGLTAPYTDDATAALTNDDYWYIVNGHLKFWVFDQPGVSYVPFIRASEMLLIEAEANHFLNQDSEAQKNLIELNKTSGRNPNYTCTKTGDDMFKEIKDYRELELWGEGFNWYDMKRWNLDIVRTSFNDGGNSPVATAVTLPASGCNKWTWDIPEDETQYNGDVK